MSQLELLDERRDDGEHFDIESSEVFVASATSSCLACCRSIEVFCLYCRTARIADEGCELLRLQCLWAVDKALARQLRRWPTYRWNAQQGRFLNHCCHCGAAQEEERLHEEPGQPFYALSGEATEGVCLQALLGRVRLSGDYVIDV
jgi:hypothetical protein